MRLLFIGAHPADLIDLAGGTIASHVEAGDEVYAAAITLGIYSHPVPDMRRASQLKRDECRKALDILLVPEVNINLMFYYDGPYLDDQSFLQITVGIAQYIRKIRPDVLITHHPTEGHHPDHAKVGAWSVEAANAAGRYIIDNTNSPHRVSNVFFYGYQFHPDILKLGHVPQPPDVVVDIEGVIQKKARAFMALGSQFNTEKVVWDRLNSMEREWGRQYGFGYAEIFISRYPCRTTLLPDFGKADFYSLLRKQVEEG